jgi:uncharacterized protein YceK
MKTLLILIAIILLNGCSPYLNPNGTVNRYHGLNGKEAVKKQQQNQFVKWK